VVANGLHRFGNGYKFTMENISRFAAAFAPRSAQHFSLLAVSAKVSKRWGGGNDAWRE